MKAYLVVLGAIIITLGIIGGGLYLSANYEQYQRRVQASGAPAGSPVTMFDLAKWELAKMVGVAMLSGGVILGSLMMGMGWIGKTLEEIRDSLTSEALETLPQREKS